MARTPDGDAVRGISITTRMTAASVAKLDAQRSARGGLSRSTYIRWLITQDAKRVAQEKGH